MPVKRCTRGPGGRWSAAGRLVLAMAAISIVALVVAISLRLRGISGPDRDAGIASVVIASFAFRLAPPRGLGQAASAPSGSATASQDSSGSWNITLTVRHLKDVGPKRWYECWYVNRDGQAVSAGTFVVPPSGNGTFPMTSSADPRDFQSMEITIQSPGNGARRQPIVLSGGAKKL